MISLGADFIIHAVNRYREERGLGLDPRAALKIGMAGVLGALTLFGFGGYWLDRYRGSENYWLIIGLILGVVVGMYELAKFILKK